MHKLSQDGGAFSTNTKYKSKLLNSTSHIACIIKHTQLVQHWKESAHMTNSCKYLNKFSNNGRSQNPIRK